MAIVIGDSGDNSLPGTESDDTIIGMAGNDTLVGAAGNDSLFGDDGNDSIVAGAGNDTVYAGTGNDYVAAGYGADVIYGGDGNDQIYIETQDDAGDSVEGGAGNDYIVASRVSVYATDTIMGGADRDTILAGPNIVVDGGSTGDDADLLGFDQFNNNGSTIVFTGDGQGEATLLGGTLTFTEIEHIGGGGSGDLVDATADSTGIRVTSGGGADTVIGGSGNDSVQGGFDNDSLSGGMGGDTVLGEWGNDTVDGGDGNDWLDGGLNDDVVTGGEGNDTIDGGTGNDSLSGDAGNDSIVAGEGVDTVDGGTGNDTIDGGWGNDLLAGGEGSDVIRGSYGNDTINAGLGDTVTGGDDGDTFLVDFTAGGSGATTITIDGSTGAGLTTDYDTITLAPGLSWVAGSTVSTLDADGDSFSGSFQVTDGTNTYTVNFTEIEAPICFARGTMIMTASGEVPVEKLARGDMVLTRDNGLRPVSWIGSRVLDSATLQANPKFYPIRIRANALGAGFPKTDLIVSPQHRILVRSRIAGRMFGEDEVLLAAKQLLLVEGVDYITDCDEVEYFHLLFDEHEVIYSNGAATESLFTGPEALRSVSAEQREEILGLFPELATRDYTPRPARFVPSGRLGRKLAIRHGKKGLALYQ